MKYFSILVCMLLGSLSTVAQKHYAVMINDSKTGKPVVGASIKILSTGEVATTSESGNVVMLIAPTDSLLISSKGYKERKLYMAGQFVALTIILDPETPDPKTSTPGNKEN